MRFGYSVIALAIIFIISAPLHTEAGSIDSISNANEIPNLQIREDFRPDPVRRSAATTFPNQPPRPTGTTPNNSGCSKSAQCQSGNCQNSKCQDPQPVGSGCYKDISCQDGYVCSSHSKRYPGKCLCMSGKCNNGQFCTSDSQCMSSSYCHGASTGNGQCSTQKSNGSSCKKGSNCQSGNCVQRQCIANNTIKPGQSCNADSQCTQGNFCSILSGHKCKAAFPSGHVCSRNSVCSSGFCEGRRQKKCA